MFFDVFLMIYWFYRKELTRPREVGWEPITTPLAAHNPLKSRTKYATLFFFLSNIVRQYVYIIIIIVSISCRRRRFGFPLYASCVIISAFGSLEGSIIFLRPPDSPPQSPSVFHIVDSSRANFQYIYIILF